MGIVLAAKAWVGWNIRLALALPTRMVIIAITKGDGGRGILKLNLKYKFVYY